MLWKTRTFIVDKAVTRKQDQLLSLISPHCKFKQKWFLIFRSPLGNACSSCHCCRQESRFNIQCRKQQSLNTTPIFITTTYIFDHNLCFRNNNIYTWNYWVVSKVGNRLKKQPMPKRHHRKPLEPLAESFLMQLCLLPSGGCVWQQTHC